MNSQICLNPGCGKEFYPLSGQYRRKYCSPKCYNDYTVFVKTPGSRAVAKYDLINDVKHVYNLLGRSLLLNDYRKHGKYSTSAIYRLTSSFPDLCREAGFEPAFDKKPSPDTSKDLMDDLIKVKLQLGRIPGYMDYDKYGKFSTSTVKNLFGSFHKARLLPGYMPVDSWSIDQVSEGDGHWLSGFVEGEGCFFIQRRKGNGCEVRFTISQRVDRIDAIYEVARILGIPFSEIATEWDKGKWTKAATLNISNLSTLIFRVIPLFDKFHLRGKKGEDFRLFKTGVQILWRKHLLGGKRYLSPQEIRAIHTLCKMSQLIKKPFVTLANIKSMMKNLPLA